LSREEIIQRLDEEISRLQSARSVLLPVKLGRPAGSHRKVTVRRRKMSEEGRKRIAAAMRKAWAKRRKAAK
jgi:hypothetical protein